MNTKSIFYPDRESFLNILSHELYGTYPDLWPGNHFNRTFILIVLSDELYGTYPDLWPGNNFNRTFR